RGTLQFWPRVRAKREVARVRRWAVVKDTKLLGFLGYKAGMCHVIAIDNRPKSLSKGEEIALPATIIECPAMKVAAVNFYRYNAGSSQLVSTFFSSDIKDLSGVLTLPKKAQRKMEEINEFDDLRVLVHTQPRQTGIGTKKPKLVEIAIGGNKEEKMKYAVEKLGKEITIEEVFKEGNQVDVHAITKGKGFQGPVKRHGVMMRHHKSEKARRANVRGSWTGPKMWTVPHSGGMGYNQRVDRNKLIIKIGKEPAEINPAGGLIKYGVVRNQFLLVKGSLPGARKRVVTLTQATRADKNIPKEAPSVKTVIV
ncbi:50S ribosomal protein L3, partial [Candidatus Woesearchaeota archaeon]|nr:50S ribosomal protein L3 [Candidatus Woesearchaeota archaeon]